MQWYLDYLRSDGDYGDHTTGDSGDYISGVSPSIPPRLRLAGAENPSWADSYGRFAWIALEDSSKDVNFIVHRGDNKDGTQADRSFNLLARPEIWVKQDDGGFYTSQAAAVGLRDHSHQRPDGDYGDPSPDFNDFWGLHLWGDAIADGVGTDWTSPRPFDGVDDFGAYWSVPIKDAGALVNYIIHRGDNKDPGPGPELRAGRPGPRLCGLRR